MRAYRQGVPHPRGYGNNARTIARYVRELNILSIEDAIRRMTLLPATTFNLKHRGALKPGAWADIVVFDPDTIRDNATFEKPHQYAAGIVHLFVNGTPVIRDGERNRLRPGKMLRRGEG